MYAARQRLVNTLRGYDLWVDGYASLVHPIVRDMPKPLLSLTEKGSMS